MHERATLVTKRGDSVQNLSHYLRKLPIIRGRVGMDYGTMSIFFLLAALAVSGDTSTCNVGQQHQLNVEYSLMARTINCHFSRCVVKSMYHKYIISLPKINISFVYGYIYLACLIFLVILYTLRIFTDINLTRPCVGTRAACCIAKFFSAFSIHWISVLMTLLQNKTKIPLLEKQPIH